MKIITRVALCLALIVFSNQGAYAYFYGQAKRGWFWFEERKKAEQEKAFISPKQQLEQFKQKLDDLRYKMLASPTIENVANYRKMEQQMWSQAEKLYDSWEQANFKYPKLADKLQDPTNVYAVKLSRKIKQEQQEQEIANFIKDYDLVLFRKGNCAFCTSFEPVLKHFADKYHIKVEAVSPDDTSSSYFENKDAKELIKQLNIEGFPTVIAVHKNKKHIFELIRGLVTIDELEEYAVLAKNYFLNSQRGTDK